MADSSKPTVLIIGGLGFIGRHLALYLHENNLASEVRIVDKVLPQLAWLAPEFEEACSKEKFVQADASREHLGENDERSEGTNPAAEHIPRIFDRADGKEFDYVINCGGETRHSQPDDVYEARSFALTMTLAKECARRGISAFVETSTAHPPPHPRKETDKIQPWHNLAKWKIKASDELMKIPNLQYCALRLPHVYGAYNSDYFAMLICVARVNVEMQQDLDLLYNKDVKVNTLHVRDAASALWRAAEWRASVGKLEPSNPKIPDIFKDSSRPIAFNVVDHNDTKQQHLAEALTEVFGLKVSFVGSLASQLAKLNLDEVLDDMNEVNLQEWAELVAKKEIPRPDMSVDGSLFESTTGWKPKYETFNADSVREMVESYKRMNWWP
ncbi:hypothetical protein N7468_000874 [Penicillium chermesinum]|uniref:NAD-dependent epimerase/dehydratase domain-containing protein n=1 Tax=Penicillium chermesinum TaxID=63820 RepID=A0A9W9PH99_9EURO|nr:uncharacterized protein N7468_000874 [Penicillium chermesinum]KAJ5245891.1 hypothetical protein N7468_000874 [Penicillium chermesinum]